MLRGALSPHITDYSLEVKYEVAGEEDEFEIVEVFDKVAEGLKSSLSEVEMEKPKPRAPISLFDTHEEPNSEEKPLAKGDRYAHLPDILPPKLIQAPYKIPTLFPFDRTSIYMLMSPETVQKSPVSVILRGTSPSGPLELEIPVEALSEPAETIHQLATRRVMQELEEGRGWVFTAGDDQGVLLKERFPSKFSDMVEREAVRLGVQFQIAGKWCSFVAVAANDAADDNGKKQTGWEIAHNGKSMADSYVIDGSSRSQRLKRTTSSTAHAGGPLKYHALMGASLGRPNRRCVTRNTTASLQQSSSVSNFLIKSDLRELAAFSGTLYTEVCANLWASIDTKTTVGNTCIFGGITLARAAPPYSMARRASGLMAQPASGFMAQQASGFMAQQAPHLRYGATSRGVLCSTSGSHDMKTSTTSEGGNVGESYYDSRGFSMWGDGVSTEPAPAPAPVAVD